METKTKMKSRQETKIKRNPFKSIGSTAHLTCKYKMIRNRLANKQMIFKHLGINFIIIHNYFHMNKQRMLIIYKKIHLILTKKLILYQGHQSLTKLKFYKKSKTLKTKTVIQPYSFKTNKLKTKEKKYTIIVARLKQLNRMLRTKSNT